MQLIKAKWSISGHRTFDSMQFEGYGCARRGTYFGSYEWSTLRKRERAADAVVLRIEPDSSNLEN
jgi:hypothetical protein